ncbi:MAG: diphthine synthase [Thermoplasmata archaeon]|nr:diphthine synthase [Thermoplasmata archaeon]
MGELAFIGMGLGDERDLSRRALDRLRSSGRVFAEEYTAVLAEGSLERLEKELGRRVERLDRAAVELQTPILKALDQHPSVSLLVAGDPFAATTHVALRVAAESAGHSWTYLPNASIHTAAPSFLGLMHYRFGRTVSLPFPEPGFAPRSFLDGISANLSLGLHTLLLLDLRPKEGRFLTANLALPLLLERDSEKVVFSVDREVAVLARIGSERPAAWLGTVGQLALVDFGPPLHSIIVPASPLHFQEEAAVARFRVPKPI